jgi:23S rRNA pseudouridine1911/1915/1917 synthase
MPAPQKVTTPSELLPFLFSAWPQEKKKQIRTWLQQKAVTVNGRVSSQFNHQLLPGDVVAIRNERFAHAGAVLPGGLLLHHEDEDLLVIDKPPGLLSIATDKGTDTSAYSLLTDYMKERYRFSESRVWIVHRLDRETSGLMVFAKNEGAKKFLQSTWETVEKRYLAIVDGRLLEDEGTLEHHLDESQPHKVFVAAHEREDTRRAITHFQVHHRGGVRSQVELTIATGRRHQIRVQLAHLGHPVVGDVKYGGPKAARLALHASRLCFKHPLSALEMIFTSQPTEPWPQA